MSTIRAREGFARAVLVTGASSGIGRATALLLDRHGYHVFAGVRKREDGERLSAESSGRLCPVILDITDQKQIDAAVAFVRSRLGTDEALWGLVNNAGSCEAGPIETMSLDRARRQMEVNVIGHMAVIQAFLPLIREGRGRIVNVASAVADSPLPFFGAYAASKAAMRNISIALRQELRWWGIPVSSVEPGFITTAIWNDASALMQTIQAEDVQGRYGELLDAHWAILEPSLRIAAPPAAVAVVIKKALEARRPRALYRSGPGSRLAVVGSVRPERLVFWLLRRFVRRRRRRRSSEKREGR